MLWVAAMYNVVAILSMVDKVCLACMQKLWIILPLFMLTQRKIPGPLPPYCKQQGP